MATKITCIITTARKEEDTDYKLFQKHIVNPDYIWATDDDDDWWDVKECIHPNHESFLECTLDSLLLQKGIDSKDIQVIIVDRLGSTRPNIISNYIQKFGDIQHVADKPSIWHDLRPPEGIPELACDHPVPFTAVCNARNTGYLFARSPLVVHLDECSIMAPNFLKSAWYWYDKFGYATKGYRHIIRFMQKETYNDIEIDDSQTVVDREFENFWRGKETFRWYDPHGTWTYYSLPLDWILKVNGWEELLDGNVGIEDVEFGYRIANLPQAQMVLDRDCKVYELSTRHIQWRRPHVKFNDIFFNHYLYDNELKRHRFVRGNEMKMTKEMMDEFVKHHEEERIKINRGTIAPSWNAPHPYIYKMLEQTPFDLAKLREETLLSLVQ